MRWLAGKAALRCGEAFRNLAGFLVDSLPEAFPSRLNIACRVARRLSRIALSAGGQVILPRPYNRRAPADCGALAGVRRGMA